MTLSNENEAPRKLEVYYVFFLALILQCCNAYNSWMNLFEPGKIPSQGGLFHSWIGLSCCLEQYVDSRRLLLHSIPCEYQIIFSSFCVECLNY